MTNAINFKCAFTTETRPATFFVGGPDGMSRNRQRATRVLVCSDIVFVAACLDQCPVGLVPFRKFWTLTLKLETQNRQ